MINTFVWNEGIGARTLNLPKCLNPYCSGSTQNSVWEIAWNVSDIWDGYPPQDVFSVPKKFNNVFSSELVLVQIEELRQRIKNSNFTELEVLKIVEHDWTLIRVINKELIRGEHIATALRSSKSLVVRYVPEECLTESLCLYALSNSESKYFTWGELPSTFKHNFEFSRMVFERFPEIQQRLSPFEKSFYE